jgi:hypothetical protein
MVHEPAILAVKPELRPRREARTAPRRWPPLLGILAAIGVSLALWWMLIAALVAIF